MAKTRLFDLADRKKDLKNFSTLDYNRYKQEFRSGQLLPRISCEYKVTLADLRELAKDPDHGLHMTFSSVIEAMVGLELAKFGVMGIQVRRGPKGLDLVDAWGRGWDVKAPPSLNDRDFKPEIPFQSILRKYRIHSEPIGILLCVSFLLWADYLQLEDLLAQRLSLEQKFHLRQVTIQGF